MSSSGASRIAPFKIKLSEKGRIKDIKNIIVRVTGLSSCLNGQILDLGRDVKGIVMGFDEEEVLALVLGDEGKLRMGQEVSGISEPFAIPVGYRFLGRMVDALCLPCDEHGPIPSEEQCAVFRDSPPIMSRSPIDRFLCTGTRMIDALIPLGKGQRQLVIGDRMTGKTSVAVDTILSQKGREVICIYCCIGKSVSALEKAVGTINRAGCLDYTIVMVATDNAPAGEQYLVPFSAATMGDFFARSGRDVVVVFDDLTKHAWAYRQLSLLLERPPGREAYPGDIFYIQTQLMERAGRYNQENGGGSMTFLGIAETLQGDLTGYIPSNLISMCDGQFFLSTALYAEGQRPAIDLAYSVSIVGGKAQPPVLKRLSATLRSEYARYVELVKISRLQSALSREAERILRKGEAILASFQQGQNEPSSLIEQVVLLYMLRRGVISDLSSDDREILRREIMAFVQQRNDSVIMAINEQTDLTPELEKALDDLTTGYLAARREAK